MKSMDFDRRQVGQSNSPLAESHRPSPDQKLDTVGFYCPIPIIKSAARMRDMVSGQVLEIISDDRVILVDMPNWCRGAGQEYLGHYEAAGEIHLFVRKLAAGGSPFRAGEARQRDPVS